MTLNLIDAIEHMQVDDTAGRTDYATHLSTLGAVCQRESCIFPFCKSGRQRLVEGLLSPSNSAKGNLRCVQVLTEPF